MKLSNLPPRLTPELRQTLAIVESCPGIFDFAVATRMGIPVDSAFHRLAKLIDLDLVRRRGGAYYGVEKGGEPKMEESDR